MSVILYNEEKFLRVYQTLKCTGRDLGWLFNYPEGWDQPNGLDDPIRAFVEDLYQANIRCWNGQYSDDIRPVTSLKFRCILPSNNFQLVKDLKAIRYNTYDNNGKQYNLPKTYERLNLLIESILGEIVGKMPEYEKAEW